MKTDNVIFPLRYSIERWTILVLIHAEQSRMVIWSVRRKAHIHSTEQASTHMRHRHKLLKMHATTHWCQQQRGWPIVEGQWPINALVYASSQLRTRRLYTLSSGSSTVDWRIPQTSAVRRSLNTSLFCICTPDVVDFMSEASPLTG